jgi:hypothetical protein
MKPQRLIKIEEHSERRARDIYGTGDTRCPKIRLKGKWIQAAGFAPGQYVQVTVISIGVIELKLCGTSPKFPEIPAIFQRLDHAIAAATTNPQPK